MDHPIFVAYSPPNGVPQESKLATYMNRQSASTPVAVNNLSQTFSKIALESPVSVKKVTPQSPEFVPGARIVAPTTSASPNFFNSFAGLAGTATGPGFPTRLVDSPHSGTVSPHGTPQPSPPPLAINNCSPISHSVIEKPIGAVSVAYQENVGGTTYFYPTAADSSHTSNDTTMSSMASTGAASAYQAYPGTPSHIVSIKTRGTNGSFFISDDARMEILSRNALTLAQSDPEQFPDLPHEVDNYHDLCPLEPIPNNTIQKAHMGYQASMYKATNIKTGVRYCLRRIHGFRLQNTKCMTYVDQWKKLVHSNIVQLKEVFTTKIFNDNSLVFVYDYHPGSETLLSKHFAPDQLNGYADPFAADPSPRPYSQQKNNILRHQQSNKLPEALIWNYIIQLTSALRIIHSAGLACRSLDPTKIIITSGNRLRLSCLGVMDVIMNDTSSTGNASALIQHYQQDDLTALGKLVLALACKSTMAVQRENISTALEVVSRSYTSDLRNLIMYLLTTSARRSMIDLMPMIGARFYTQLDNVQSRTDVLENEVSKEMESGRLFRLLVKLGTINERPEFNMDGTWSETGDRYMLKLFRDHVFHQVTEDGRPWLDMAHVVQCLNKLDTGAPEKVCLMSRDEQSILVVSYAELKHCLLQSFDEILNASSSMTPAPDGNVS